MTARLAPILKSKLIKGADAADVDRELDARRASSAILAASAHTTKYGTRRAVLALRAPTQPRARLKLDKRRAVLDMIYDPTTVARFLTSGLTLFPNP